VKGWRRIYTANRIQKQAGVAIFISDKGNFKPKLEDKENH
jgi:hypothetical protein